VEKTEALNTAESRIRALESKLIENNTFHKELLDKERQMTRSDSTLPELESKLKSVAHNLEAKNEALNYDDSKIGELRRNLASTTKE